MRRSLKKRLLFRRLGNGQLFERRHPVEQARRYARIFPAFTVQRSREIIVTAVDGREAEDLEPRERRLGLRDRLDFPVDNSVARDLVAHQGQRFQPGCDQG